MDLETIEQIVGLLEAHPISEIVLEQEGARLIARKALRANPSSQAIPSESNHFETVEETQTAALSTEEMPDTGPVLLTAALVGLFRHSEPPVGYGALIEPGQVVGSIEAVKVLNDVRAEFGGIVVDVLIEDGAPVEYGQALFRLMPGSGGLS